MSIILTGTGGLFTRLGQYAGLLNAVNTFRGGDSAGQLVKETTDVFGELDGDTAAIRATAASLLNNYPQAQTSLGAYLSTLQKAAQALLIAQVNADTPLAQQTVPYALAVLKTQMLAGGYHVAANTLSATPTATVGNAGNGAIVCGVRDKYGYQLDNLLAESIAVGVTSTATAGAEGLQFQGAAAQADALNWAWPAGSGLNRTLTSLDAAAGGNLIAGGAFDTFTANLPAAWTAATGTAGTDFAAAGSSFKGANALKLIGGTGVLTSLTQALGGLSSRTPYAINLWLKNDVNPAAGNLVLDLYNGASVIQDEGGNNCSLSIDLTTLGTAYTPKSAVWRIADPLPSTVTLRVRLATAISAGSNTYVDQLALQPATQLGAQLGDSIWAAVFSGSANWGLRDTLTIAAANNRACAWQQAFDRFFGCRALGFVLPTTGATLISDALIS